MNKPITIREIARKLKISPSTVSRALHDHPSIGLITTMRVKKMAKECNYEPNQTAIFFKQRKTFTIGVILPKLSEPFFSSAISAIENIAQDHNYTVLLGQSLDDAERELKIINTFKKHRVDGILMSLGKNTNDLSFINKLETSEIPIVFFDCVPAVPNINKVYCELTTGIKEAIEAFISRGHQNIALINGPEKLLASMERIASFKNVLNQKGIAYDNKFIIHTDLTEEGNIAAMEQLIRLTERPTAVVSFNDFVTLDIIKLARHKGIAVGQEMHFISFANYPLWQYIENTPLGSIEQYPGEQAKAAAEILFDIINKKVTAEPKEIIFKSKLILK